MALASTPEAEDGANRFEPLGTLLSLRRARQRHVARGRFCCPDKAREDVNIFQSVGSGFTVRLGSGIA